jgi:hypothetical protein
MDATLKILHPYVASILIVSICSISVSIAFAFGLAENVKLYNMFNKTFAQVFGTDLSQYIVEYDQGSVIVTHCTKYEHNHLF